MSISACARDAQPSSRPTVNDIFRMHGSMLPVEFVSAAQLKLFNDICVCRTPMLGGHRYECPDCGYELHLNNSCRNRSCSNCQSLKQAEWLDARLVRMLPVRHHHVVFTLPSELRPLASYNKKKIYGALFHCAAKTLSVLANEVIRGQLAVTAVLHTWTRRLLLHPHVHCIVSAGGLRLGKGYTEDQWLERRNYLFPVARMKGLFRSLFVRRLEELWLQGGLVLPGRPNESDARRQWTELIRSLPDKWVVFIKPQLSSTDHLVRYLARYTHRAAISNQRLLKVVDDEVTFVVRKGETATLKVDDFIRRFLLHALPSGFRKIRHYGLYAPANVNGRLELARSLTGGESVDIRPREFIDEGHDDADDTPAWAKLLERLTGKDPLRCPNCDNARMLRVAHLAPRAPPRGPL